MGKKRKEEWKVWGNVFDMYTERNLFKLISQGYFEELLSPVSVGKEANIFTARKKDGTILIVKIYRLQTCNFNGMYNYIKQDPRYQHLKKHRRKIIFAWAQREYRNLLKARKAGVRVPAPYAVLDNIIVMELIGRGEPALQLKDLYPTKKRVFFNQIVDYMAQLWKANVVHGDLSGFNILNYDDRPVFIDFSQASDIKANNSVELLDRDIKNIAVLFAKIGLKNINQEKIKKKIINCP